MKQNKSLLFIFLLLIVIASVYRVWDGRPWGFVPQIAMALFGGAVIRDKKWAFILPLLSMLLSDALYEVLYQNGLSEIQGFYSGQVTNYVLFAGMTFIGFWMHNLNKARIALGSVVAPSLYFLLSNFQVWIGGGGLQRPKTFDGLMQCYADGAPFYKGYLLGTLFFSIVLFGIYFLYKRNEATQKSLA
ncbi:MAG TPA: DUF6580 family putative transport protein [Chitinophagaceae bacterium]|nr:DUF6580 family putative transport protein [Chitinophagaceae bacterium]